MRAPTNTLAAEFSRMHDFGLRRPRRHFFSPPKRPSSFPYRSTPLRRFRAERLAEHRLFFGTRMPRLRRVSSGAALAELLVPLLIVNSLAISRMSRIFARPRRRDRRAKGLPRHHYRSYYQSYAFRGGQMQVRRGRSADAGAISPAIRSFTGAGRVIRARCCAAIRH